MRLQTVTNLTPLFDMENYFYYNTINQRPTIARVRQAVIKDGTIAGNLPEFQPVTAESMKLIMPFLEAEQGRTTDFSFGGLLMWVDYFKYEFCIYRNTLFIKGLVEDNTSLPAFSLPVGNLSLSESVSLLSEYCRQRNIRLEFSAVPEHAVAEFAALDPVRVQELEAWGDYLYDIDSLSQLSGKKMAKKRNHVNRFIADNPEWRVEPLVPQNVDMALLLMDVYDKEADGAPMEGIESCLSRKMLGLISDGITGFEGALLISAGRPVAFTIGDVKGDTLFVHIEKAARSVAGSYEMINKCFAQMMKEKYPELRYVNREDDSGDEGLRQAKLSYRPLTVLRKFNIIF